MVIFLVVIKTGNELKKMYYILFRYNMFLEHNWIFVTFYVPSRMFRWNKIHNQLLTRTWYQYYILSESKRRKEKEEQKTNALGMRMEEEKEGYLWERRGREDTYTTERTEMRRVELRRV